MSTIGEPPRLLPSLALTPVKRTPCGAHSRWAGWCRCMRPWYAQRPTIVRHTGTWKQARWKPSLSRTRRAPCPTDCFDCANFYINDSISFSTRYISFSKKIVSWSKKIFVSKKAKLSQVRERDYITFGSKIVGAGATTDSHSSFSPKQHVKQTNPIRIFPFSTIWRENQYVAYHLPVNNWGGSWETETILLSVKPLSLTKPRETTNLHCAMIVHGLHCVLTKPNKNWH